MEINISISILQLDIGKITVACLICIIYEAERESRILHRRLT